MYIVPLAQCHDESQHSDIYEYVISREENTFRAHANKNVCMENDVHRHDESEVQYICLHTNVYSTYVYNTYVYNTSYVYVECKRKMYM